MLNENIKCEANQKQHCKWVYMQPKTYNSLQGIFFSQLCNMIGFVSLGHLYNRKRRSKPIMVLCKNIKFLVGYIPIYNAASDWPCTTL